MEFPTRVILGSSFILKSRPSDSLRLRSSARRASAFGLIDRNLRTSKQRLLSPAPTLPVEGRPLRVRLDRHDHQGHDGEQGEQHGQGHDHVEATFRGAAGQRPTLPVLESVE